MPILTATEVTVLTDISITAGTIIARGLIPTIQEEINVLTNNFFVTDIYVQNTMTFIPSSLTIIGGSSFEDRNFVSGDEIYISNSYRNDGYYIIDEVTDNAITLATGSTIYSELAGKSIIVSLVSWPRALKEIAALMIAYNVDTRGKRSKGLSSRSLGPLSESYKDGTGSKYPDAIMGRLESYTLARMV